jgi:uncharacterized protein YgbK (DUF1537 family)
MAILPNALAPSQSIQLQNPRKPDTVCSGSFRHLTQQIRNLSLHLLQFSIDVRQLAWWDILVEESIEVDLVANATKTLIPVIAEGLM